MHGAFERLIAEIAQLDPDLAKATRDVEGSWATGEARDSELTDVVADVLLGADRAGVFTIRSMTEGFRAFAHEFHVRQHDFLRSGRYQARDYEELRKKVYADDAYMGKVYYPALLFSYLAAPNYREILRCLDQTLDAWRQANVSRVLDVASGHALLLLFALRELPSAHGLGVDISPVALEFARSLADLTGWGTGRFQFSIADVMSRPDDGAAATEEAFDAAICCELLEHVPEPGRVLRSIHGRLRDGGRLFVSAAVRMESVDHLTLFKTTAEVGALLAENGFHVDHEMSVPFMMPKPPPGHWKKLLDNRTVAATFVGHCHRVG